MSRNEVSLLDETLLRAAASGKSGDEMEKLTGIPGAQAVMHVKELLGRRDIWTEVERRQLLLSELQDLKDSLTQNAVDFRDPDSAKLLLKVLQEIGKRLDVERSKLDIDIIKLSEYQQKILLRAMDSALNFAKKELAERFPVVPKDELDALISEGLILAKYEIEKEGQ
jgi:chemotaxis protein CheY-P-specific phosphatase CheC